MRTRRIRDKVLVISFFVWGCSYWIRPAEARVVRITIDNVETPAFSGRSFGKTGRYELISGHARGELDPTQPQNALIQDIALAPRNARGMVEYAMPFQILRPRDAGRSNGVLLYDVVNRGNKMILNELNIGADHSNIVSDAGDGFLEQNGYTLVWSGWEGDVPAASGRLVLDTPIAKYSDGSAITGTVRSDYVVNVFTHTQGLSSPDFSVSQGLESYETATLDNSHDVLTKRMREADPPVAIPNARWSFADCSSTPFPGKPSSTKICLEDGFDPNFIYDLTYTAKNPRVLGIGFAATRDIIGFFRHQAADDAGIPNPLWNRTHAAIANGTSQSGNYLRTFLLLGFNQDEQARMVFDAMDMNVTSRYLALNIRFAQPGRLDGEHVDHLYPGFEAPLSWTRTRDEISGLSGSPLDRCRATDTCPKMFQLLSSTEYWQQQGSTNTTDAEGKRDLPIPKNVRIYLIASTQHSPAAKPSLGISQQLSNPNPQRETLRALLVALQEWTAGNVEPPPDCLPRLRTGTLVRPNKSEVGWPDIPGVTFTGLVNTLPFIDWGPQFNAADESGVLEVPPVISKEKEYAILVPKVDADGNEIAGIRTITLQAPLGTYTGWNLRRAGFSQDEITQLTGSYIPFAKTRKQRAASGDPRLSLEERYHNHAGYVDAVRAAAKKLVAERFLLPDDAARLIREAEAGEVLR